MVRPFPNCALGWRKNERRRFLGSKLRSQPFEIETDLDIACKVSGCAGSFIGSGYSDTSARYKMQTGFDISLPGHRNGKIFGPRG
ncbi:MAG: hypothetical protein ACREHF_04400 [Rhizomicrobium sp.]